MATPSHSGYWRGNQAEKNAINLKKGERKCLTIHPNRQIIEPQCLGSVSNFGAV